MKTAQHSSAGDRSFDREVTGATGPVASFGGVTQPQQGGGLMPPASVHDGNTAGLPAARETRTRGLVVCEIIADSAGNGLLGHEKCGTTARKC